MTRRVPFLALRKVLLHISGTRVLELSTPPALMMMARGPGVTTTTRLPISRVVLRLFHFDWRLDASLGDHAVPRTCRGKEVLPGTPIRTVMKIAEMSF